jgi:hypothetical protein
MWGDRVEDPDFGDFTGLPHRQPAPHQLEAMEEAQEMLDQAVENIENSLH